jgi:hypothetical protein
LYTPDGQQACLSVHRLTSAIAVTLKKRGYHYSYNISHTEGLYENVVALLNDIGVDGTLVANYVFNWHKLGDE